jgi:hypothetical protein
MALTTFNWFSILWKMKNIATIMFGLISFPKTQTTTKPFPFCLQIKQTAQLSDQHNLWTNSTLLILNSFSLWYLGSFKNKICFGMFPLTSYYYHLAWGENIYFVNRAVQRLNRHNCFTQLKILREKHIKVLFSVSSTKYFWSVRLNYN